MPKGKYRKNGYKKKGKVAALTRKVNKIAKVMSNVECKSFVVLYNNGTPAQSSNAVSVDELSGVALGTGDGNRVGDKIGVVGIEFCLYSWCLTTNTNQGNITRLLIFRDMGYDGTNPAIGSDLLANYDVTTGRVSNFISPKTSDNFPVSSDTSAQRKNKRFHLLKELLVNHNTGVPQPTKCNRISLKFSKALPVQYSGNQGLQGSIFVAIFNGYSTTTGENPYKAWESRLQFQDL